MNARRMKFPGPTRLVVLMLLTVGVSACAESLTDQVRDDAQSARQSECSIPIDSIFSGAFRDGIPALTNPEMATFGAEGTEYLQGDDRVIGLVLGGQPMAIPLNIGWWHEIVNLLVDGSSVAVTHCPLTGSSLAFDRGPVAGAEFGVSGLLYQNNLIMYNRSRPESLWPQMIRGARCGPADGTALPMIPVAEMTWHGWVALHPSTVVVTDTGQRDYTRSRYPYGSYDLPNNKDLLFPMPGPIDTRRPPKERALGVPDGSGGLVFPFGELRAAANAADADLVVARGATSAGDFVVFYDDDVVGGMAFRPTIDGDALTFSVDLGRIRDNETGSRWTIDGRAVDGPLAGRTLEPVAEAFVAFWFAWAAFYPDLDLWSAS